MTLVSFSTALLFSSTAFARSIPLTDIGLLPRATTCGGNTNLTQCGGNFPSNFCCPTGTTCFGFNNDQGVVCCPGNDCSLINTLSCDPVVYDATAFPETPVHMTNLSQSALTQCGSSGSCCPVGYTCGGNECHLDAISSSSTTSGATPTTGAGSTATNPASTSASPTLVTGIPNNLPSTTPTGSAASSSPAVAPVSSGPQFPIEAVLVGLFPGLVGGCLIAFLLVCCLRGRKAKKLTSDSSSSLGPTMAKISDPIYTVDPTATRTDFLRHASRRIVRKASGNLLGSNHSPGTESSLSRVRSLFRKTPTTSRTGDQSLWTTHPSHVQRSDHDMPDPESAAERALEERLARSTTVSTSAGPRTPRREPSTESIPIYNLTPSADGHDRSTVFADLMPSTEPIPKMPILIKPGTHLMSPVFFR